MPRRREDDLDRELRDHLELEAEEQQEAGLPPDEARNAARRAFGNVRLVKEEQIFHVMRSIGDGEFGNSYVLLGELTEAARPAGEIFATAAFGLRKFGLDASSFERVVGEPVSGNFFSALRVSPAVGRVFASADDTVLGGNRVAVLSHAFWTRRFQGN